MTTNEVIAMDEEIPRDRSGLGRLASWALVLLAFVAAGCGDPDRRILERLDSTEIARFRSGRAAAMPCWTCHDLAGTVKKVGPSLLGLYGRRSGESPGFSASPAIRSASIVWDDASLAAFLRNPSGFVPGNRMVYPGLQNERALQDLLFYLRHVTSPGAREAPPS